MSLLHLFMKKSIIFIYIIIVLKNLSMKKVFYILFLFLFSVLTANAQYALDNTGGKIDNQGTIRIRSGQVKNLPDTLKGRVEFTNNYAFSSTSIPNIVYYQLVFSGKNKKEIDSVYQFPRRLVAQDSLIINNNAEVITYRAPIDAKSTVDLSASVIGQKEFRLINETQSQNIFGNGSAQQMTIDNPFGVNVVNGANFRVDSLLVLNRGTLNNTQSNFRLKDSVLIVRTDSSSISVAPGFEGKSSVIYRGNSIITTGYEIPKDTTALLDLSVNNSGGIILNKNITVNRNLYLNDRIYAEWGKDTFILHYTPAFNPLFSVNPQAEIVGNFRRSGLSYDSSKMLFNNKYTWAIFPDDTSANNIKVLNFRIVPKEFQALSEGDLSKVKRSITITGFDDKGDTVTEAKNMTIGYGWRYSNNSDIDENLGMAYQSLVLKHWAGNGWDDVNGSRIPAISNSDDWAYSYAEKVTQLGFFAIGAPGAGGLLLSTKVFLEGPYRYGSMSTDLLSRHLIPATPPDVYPYNLDSKRATYFVPNTPDSVVDWIVIEFRQSGKESKYITCFLKQNGSIIGQNGEYPLVLTKLGVDSGDYTIGIHHRNHLAIYTSDPIKIRYSSNKDVVDFTNPKNVFGNEGSLKPLDEIKGFILWGMVAGDVDGDGDIDELDYKLTWQNRDLEIYNNYDVNMSGINTTKDMNFPWNNLGRKANTP